MPAGAYYIEDVRWSEDMDGEPTIHALIDGAPSKILMMQKSKLLDADLVLVDGAIDRVAVSYGAIEYAADSGLIQSAYIALMVRDLTRAYLGGYMKNDPRFTPGL
jgi:hypothetical protein